jgi:hypothetical protein
LSDLLGFICYNEIRDRVRGEGNEDGEVGGEVGIEERRVDDDERRDIGSGDVRDRDYEGIADFKTIALISSLPSSSSSILSRQSAKSLGRLSLIRCKRAEDG